MPCDALMDVLGPLLQGPSIPADIPYGLRRLAEERRITTSEVQVLASLRVAGKTPVSTESMALHLRRDFGRASRLTRTQNRPRH